MKDRERSPMELGRTPFIGLSDMARTFRFLHFVKEERKLNSGVQDACQEVMKQAEPLCVS